MTCTGYRGVEARIAWFLSHKPAGVGMCAQHSWHALGGDRGCPPRWGKPHANAVYDAVKASGRYFTGAPPRGALVLWRYGKYGHAAIALGNGKIATTDPNGKPGGVGIEGIGYPKKWGATRAKRIWTDQYAGTRFTVEDKMGVEYFYGGKPSGKQTVKRKYVTVDRSRWNPLRKGLELALVYLNIAEATFQDGKSSGTLRIRAVREKDNDKTSYHDYIVHKGMGTPQLITHTYFESGDGGPTHYEVKCMGGLASVVLDTRYRKGAVIY